ncbi:MAG: NAD(P)-dependent oxidoreductase [Anaerolineae bacterium]
MKILLTGAFGNIGTSVVQELVKRPHQLTCFDLKTNYSTKTAARFGERINVIWGDVRSREDVARAVQGQDVVIHTAALIPHQSITGLESEAQPDLARAVNVEGTRNVIEAIKAQAQPPKLVFTSSLHIYGQTQHLPPPRTVNDELHPIEHYAKHKQQCEQMIKESGITWAILRLSAALPVRLILDDSMFNVPLDNRIEYVHTGDVGLALSNAAESDSVWGKTLLIGGGRKCQMVYRDLVKQVFGAVGIGALPESAFTTVPYSVDWLDTDESQRLLNYQRRTLDDYVRDTLGMLGYLQPVLRLTRPLVRYIMLRQSSYYWQRKPSSGEVLRHVFD